MNRNTLRMLTGLLVPIALLGLACSQTANPVSPEAAYPPANATIQEAHASWAVGYGSLAQIVADSQAVITGTVVSARPFQHQPDGLLMTEYAVDVASASKGDVRASDRVLVVQTGGVLNGKGMEFGDDPLMRVGESYLLFLQRPEGSPTYAASGGPLGRYIIASDVVRSRSVDYPGRAIPSVGDISDRPLTSVLADVANYATLPPPTFPTAPVGRP